MSSNSIYLPLYHKLCQLGKNNFQFYRKGSGLHRHHIIPKHVGGLDEEYNFTYLSPRQHKLAHWMLWKIYRNVNDLRSCKLLGAQLTTQYRIIVEEYCKDAPIGSVVSNNEVRLEYLNAYWTQRRETGTMPVEFGWQEANKDLVKQWQISGGKIAGTKSRDLGTGIFGLSKEDQLRYSSMGGKLSKIWEYKYITNGVENSRAMEIPDGWWEGWTATQAMKDKRAQSIQESIFRNKCKLSSHITENITNYTNYEELNCSLIANVDLQYKIYLHTKSVYPLSKHGVCILISDEEYVHETYRTLISDGWRAFDYKRLDQYNSKHEVKRYTMITKYGYQLTCPDDKLQLLLDDSWIYATLGKFCKVVKIVSDIDYILNIPTENLSEFLNMGWTVCRDKQMKNPPTEGAHLTHPSAAKSIKVNFEDIPTFYTMGFSVLSKHRKERNRIQRSIRQYSPDFSI